MCSYYVLEANSSTLQFVILLGVRLDHYIVLKRKVMGPNVSYHNTQFMSLTSFKGISIQDPFKEAIKGHFRCFEVREVSQIPFLKFSVMQQRREADDLRRCFYLRGNFHLYCIPYLLLEFFLLFSFRVFSRGH